MILHVSKGTSIAAGGAPAEGIHSNLAYLLIEMKLVRQRLSLQEFESL
ncbi:hypothetical protein N8766_04295 [bacterium]|nr:hypothetical protein [bacterium]MDA7657683.1 hypothetical protein [Verrucomicrobiota bacterium]